MVATTTSVRTVVLAFILLGAEIAVLAITPSGEDQSNSTFFLTIFTMVLLMIPTAFSPHYPDGKDLLLGIEKTARKGSLSFFIMSVLWIILIVIGIWRAESIYEIPLIPLIYHILGFVFTSWASWSYSRELMETRRSLRELEVMEVMDE